MEEKKRGLAAMTPERRAEVIAKAQAARAENRRAKAAGEVPATPRSGQTVITVAGVTMTKKLTPMRAIRLKCLDCCTGQHSEVKKCTAHDCPLYKYRGGRRSGTVDDELAEADPTSELDEDIPLDEDEEDDDDQEDEEGEETDELDI
jgi:hypothetical protein